MMRGWPMWRKLRPRMRQRRMFRRQHRHPDAGQNGFAASGSTVVELQADELSRVFAVPPWLRDLGLMSWLLVGAFVLIAGLVLLMSLTAVIVIPVLTASIIAAVLSPLVSCLATHKVGRGGGAALVLLGVVALGVLVAVLLFSGVVSEGPQ